ncbi:MAG: CocE/NonD family hydrolase, partial [Betaproteobacteria bacterium]|nr:CocE/NonD family hydrolase [Betaproteobacteria bacterium]
SEGVFDPWINEGSDGYDVVEALALLPDSTGRIGMWGGSYGGFLQWAVAAKRPPHLYTIIPAAAGLPAVDFPMNRNIMRPYVASWLAYTSARTGHDRYFDDLPYQSATYRRLFTTGIPQAEADSELGFASAIYQRFLAHPTFDDFWRARAPSAAELQAISIPVLSVTGYWDSAQVSALEYWTRANAAGERNNQLLLIGPFDHGGTRHPTPTVGGLPIEPPGVIDMHALDVAWFRWTLQDGPRPEFLANRVTYFVTRDGTWRHARVLSQVASAVKSLYLTGGGPERRGQLADRPLRASATASYRNDPADFSKIDQGTWFVGSWVTHDRDVRALTDDGLVYDTQPLERALFLAGRPTVKVRLAIDAPDADFRVRLYEVAPNGGSVFLGQDRIRARYRTSVERAELVKPGRPYDYSFDRLAFMVRRIAPQHRLRLVIDTPNSVHDQRNFNSGKPIAFETVADSKATVVRLTEGGSYAARIDMPIASN